MADESSTMSIKVHGKTVEMPIEKIKTLAQQGLNQSKVQEQIKADRAKLEEDSARYDEYQKLRAHLEANPLAAQAVQRALQDPSRVLEPEATNDAWGDETQEHDVSNREMDELRRELAALKSSVAERDQKDLVSAQERQIDKEVSEYPWLESGRARDMARQQIAAMITTNPNQDLASVTALVANEMRELLEDAKTQQARAVPDRRRLQTEKPMRGAPPVSTSETPTKQSFNDGSLLKMTKEAARAFGLPVD